MTSIGDKVKQMIRGGPHSIEAERGEVDKRTPGSFPDDVATPPATKDSSTGQLENPNTMTSTGSDRNRLHKAGDPRGDMDPHRHKDSGVGLPTDDPHDLSQPRTQATGQPQREGGLQQDHKPAVAAAGGGLGGTAPTAEPDVTNAPTNREEAAAQQKPAAAAGIQTGDKPHESGTQGESTEDHPYWGDIPKGAGVYNGVTGHGSHEDRQRTEQRKPGAGPTQAGSSDPVSELTGSTQQRAFPLQSSTGANTSDQHQQRDVQQGGQGGQGESRFKEGLAGAGTAAGAGAAAYGLSQHRDQHAGQQSGVTDQSKVGQTQPAQGVPAQTQETKEHKEGGSKLGGLFHKGNKEDKEAKAQREAAEKREKELKKQQEQHEKDLKKQQHELEKQNKAKETKEHGGLFGHHGQKQQQDVQPQAQQQQPIDNRAATGQSGNQRYGEAGMAAAAATTAYAAHEHGKDKGTHPEQAAHDEKEKERRGSKLGAIFGLGKKDDKKAKDHHDPQTTDAAARAMQPAAAQTATGSTAPYVSPLDNPSRPRDETHVPIGQRSGEQAMAAPADKGSHAGPAMGALAAGAGAGYGAHRLAGDHHEREQQGVPHSTSHGQQPTTIGGMPLPASQQTSTSRDMPIHTKPTDTTAATHQDHGSSLGKTAAATGLGAGAGYGASRLAGQHGHSQDTSTTGFDHKMQQAYGGAGHYQTPQPGPGANTTAAAQHSDHSAAKAAAAGVAAGGAGTAAYQYATRDSSHPQSATQGAHQGVSSSHPSSTQAGTSGGFTAPQTHNRSALGGAATGAASSAAGGIGSPSRSGTESGGVEYNYLADGTPSGIKVTKGPSSSSTGTHGPTTGESSLASAAHKGISQAPHTSQTAHDSSRSGALGSGAAAGAAAAAGAGGAGYMLHDRHEKEKEQAKEREQLSSHAPQGTAGQTKQTSTQPPHGVVGQNQPTTRDTDTTRQATSHDDKSKAPALAAAAAGAGVGGAGYNTYERHQREKEQHAALESGAQDRSKQPAAASIAAPASTTDTTSKQPGQATTSTTQSTSQAEPSHGGAYNVLPSGTESGVNAGDNQIPSMAGSTPMDPSSLTQSREATGPATQANKGEYNTLPSGTDSGVNTGATGQTSSLPEQRDDKSSGYKTAAAAGAGALGAGGLGAAVMGSRDNDSERLSQRSGVDEGKSRLADSTNRPGEPENGKKKLADPTSREDPSRKGPFYGGGLAAATKAVEEGKKVTHSCSKCGNADDISHYFKK